MAKAFPDLDLVTSIERSQAPRPPRTRLTRRGVKVVAAIAAAAGAAGTWFVTDTVSDMRENQAQPTCDVVAQATPGLDSVSGIKGRLGRAGDSGDGVEVYTASGRKRNTLYAGPQGVPTVDAIQPGDSILVRHVDPAVCLKVGGIVLPDGARPTPPRDAA